MVKRFLLAHYVAIPEDVIYGVYTFCNQFSLPMTFADISLALALDKVIIKTQDQI